MLINRPVKFSHRIRVHQPMLSDENTSALLKADAISKKYVKSFEWRHFYSIIDQISWIRSRYWEKPRLRKNEIWGIYNVSLALNEGETVGIIGLKGSGKSTLLELVSGRMVPDYGSIHKLRNVPSHFWAGESANDSEENLITLACRWGLPETDVSDKIEEIQKELDIGISAFAPARDYSKKFLNLIACCLFLKSSLGIVFIDDFLGYIDIDEKQKIIDHWDFLTNNSTAQVLVLGDLEAGLSLCDRMILVNDHSIQFDGDPGRAVDTYDQNFRIRPDLARKSFPLTIGRQANEASPLIEIEKTDISWSKPDTNIGDSCSTRYELKINRLLRKTELQAGFIHTSSHLPGTRIWDICKIQTHNVLSAGKYLLNWDLSIDQLPPGLFTPIMRYKTHDMPYFCEVIHLQGSFRLGGHLPRKKRATIGPHGYSLKPGHTYGSHSNAFESLKPGMLCIDCGANIGDVTQLMLMRGCRVIAFEPNSVAFSKLRKRFEGIEEVTCIPKGVYSEDTICDLYFPQNFDKDPIKYSVGSSIVSGKEFISIENKESIELIDIADFLMELNEPVALMKIDIEGAEYKVLNRLIDSKIISQIDQLIVEEHIEQIPSLQNERKIILDKIAKNRIRNIDLSWI